MTGVLVEVRLREILLQEGEILKNLEVEADRIH